MASQTVIIEWKCVFGQFGTDALFSFNLSGIFFGRSCDVFCGPDYYIPNSLSHILLSQFNKLVRCRRLYPRHFSLWNQPLSYPYTESTFSSYSDDERVGYYFVVVLVLLCVVFEYLKNISRGPTTRHNFFKQSHKILNILSNRGKTFIF